MQLRVDLPDEPVTKARYGGEGGELGQVRKLTLQLPDHALDQVVAQFHTLQTCTHFSDMIVAQLHTLQTCTHSNDMTEPLNKAQRKLPEIAVSFHSILLNVLRC